MPTVTFRWEDFSGNWQWATVDEDSSVRVWMNKPARYSHPRCGYWFADGETQRIASGNSSVKIVDWGNMIEERPKQ